MSIKRKKTPQKMASVMFNCELEDRKKLHYIARFCTPEGNMSELMRTLIKATIEKHRDKLPKKL